MLSKKPEWKRKDCLTYPKKKSCKPLLSYFPSVFHKINLLLQCVFANETLPYYKDVHGVQSCFQYV